MQYLKVALVAHGICLAVWANTTSTPTDGSLGGAERNGDAVEHIIIGAGPAGIQSGFYLHHARMDYVILDKQAEFGSFFRRYPKFRKLISINKRHTTRQELEFRLRHDWNSLLQDLPLGAPNENDTQLSNSFDFRSGKDPVKNQFPSYSKHDGELNMSLVRNENNAGSMVDSMLSWKGEARRGQAWPPLHVRHLTKDFFPHADTLADYIQMFAERFDLRIRTKTAVESVSRIPLSEAVALQREKGLGWLPRYRV